MATSCQDADFFPGIIYYLFSRSFARWLAALSFTSYPLIEQQLDNLSRGFFHSRHIKVKLLFIYELHIWSKSMAKSISFLQLFLRDISFYFKDPYVYNIREVNYNSKSQSLTSMVPFPVTQQDAANLSKVLRTGKVIILLLKN